MCFQIRSDARVSRLSFSLSLTRSQATSAARRESPRLQKVRLAAADSAAFSSSSAVVPLTKKAFERARRPGISARGKESPVFF